MFVQKLICGILIERLRYWLLVSRKVVTVTQHQRVCGRLCL